MAGPAAQSASVHCEEESSGGVVHPQDGLLPQDSGLGI